MEGAQVMTDKQWEGILLMVRSMAEMCESKEQIVRVIDNVLEGKKKIKGKEIEE